MSAAPAGLDAATIRIGSAEHRRLLAQFFNDTHAEYVPEKTDWPLLSGAELKRLTAPPFWQEAV